MKVRRRPTQTDIARDAGVSTAVVSLVINDRADGKIRISPATQQRVWASVQRLGYVPNMAAQRLAGGRTRLLGVFTFEPIFPVETSNFYFPILVGVEESAERYDHDLVLFTRTSQENGRRSIYRNGVNALELTDGAILLGTHENRDELLQLHRSGYPFVFVGRREVAEEHLPSVGADYTTASRDVIELLLRYGHLDILHIHSCPVNESAADRRHGVTQALEAHGLPVRSDRSRHIAIEHLDIPTVRGWLDDGITAVVVDHLPLAIRLREIAVTMQLHIPGDLSIAALGNSGDPTADLVGITTFLIPRREMGAQAVARLVDRLEGRPFDPTDSPLLPCTLWEGITVGTPRGRAAHGTR